MAKLLAADASWEAANVAVQTHGGFGFAEDYDIERKFRETRLYQVAPISTNLILTYVAEVFQDLQERQIFAYGMLLAVLMFVMPQGIMGSLGAVYDRLTARSRTRRRHSRGT